MWHVYKNKQRKFEVCFVKNGKYIVGSKQGYSRKRQALHAAFTACGLAEMFIQDDDKEIIINLLWVKRLMLVTPTKRKISKKYKP